MGAGIATVPVTVHGANRTPLTIQPLVLEVRNMSTETHYKGRTIHLTANQSSGGTWTGTAQFPDEPGRLVETDGTFPTKDEALSAALSQAIAVVDRERMYRGKP